MDPKIVTPVMLCAFVALALIRRVMRNIGRQRIRPVRMQLRIGIFAVVGVLVLAASLHRAALFEALAAGLAAGAALGWFGLQHTRFESAPDGGAYYTPHTYIGLFVSVLFLARIAYRFMVVYPAMQAAAQANTLAAYQRSPLTLGIFGVVVGYYVAYYIGVLGKSRTLTASAGSG